MYKLKSGTDIHRKIPIDNSGNISSDGVSNLLSFLKVTHITPIKQSAECNKLQNKRVGLRMEKTNLNFLGINVTI